MPKKPKWNEVACPKCREPIAVDATRCPHCHADFSAEEVAARQKDQVKAGLFGCGGVLALLLLIGWCSMPESIPEQPGPTAKEDEASPTSYYIRHVDLYREEPQDICRARDRDFLQRLMMRVSRALPVDTGASMQFHDFNVTDANPAGERSAVLRFKALFDGNPDTLMYATGDFDVGSCAIRNLRAGVGAYPDPNADDEISVDGR